MAKKYLGNLAQTTKLDEELLLNSASKIYSLCMLLIPAILFVGFVVAVELIDAGVSSIAVTCVGIISVFISLTMYSVALMSTLVAKMLTHIADVVLQEGEDFADVKELVRESDALIERMSLNSADVHDAICPSCELPIHMNDTQCPRCRAIFYEGAPWGPIPINTPSAEH